MDVSELIVEVRDANLNRLGQLTDADLVGFVCVPRVNDVGNWELHLPQTILDPESGAEVDYELTQALREEGAGIIVTDPLGVVLSGPMTEAKFEQTAEEPGGLWTITGVSDDVVLQDALAFPDPANADPTAQTRDNDTRSARAETILYQYVSANIGPAAPDGRRWDDLSFDPDQGRGPVLYAAPRFDNLLTLLQGLASVSGLAFDVVQDGAGRVFRVREPLDRSALVQMDVANEQLTTVDHGYGAPTATRAIVAGPGDAVLDRTFVFRTTAESLRSEAAWGRRIEGFVADTSTDDRQVLSQEGDQALAESGSTVYSTSITPSEDLAATYRIDWSLGDLVSVVVGGTPAQAPVTSVTLKVDGGAVLLGATLGDPIGFDPEGVAYKVATSTEQRVSSLERSGASGTAVGVTPIEPFLVGEVKAVAFSGTPAGWLACDGRAVSRTDYASLFSAIGTTYGAGDGSTTFSLPDLADRIPVGAGGTLGALGATGGELKHTLTAAEMPSHGHTASTSGAGGHSHSGSTDSQGQHTHNTWTGSGGGHSHGGWTTTNGDHGHTGLSVNGTRVNWGNSVRASGSGATIVANGNDSDVVVKNAGNHSHQISWDGDHTHGVGMDGAGNHAHNFGTSSVGDHSHAVTVQSTGGGAAHNVVQPYVVLRYLIKA